MVPRWLQPAGSTALLGVSAPRVLFSVLFFCLFVVCKLEIIPQTDRRVSKALVSGLCEKYSTVYIFRHDALLVFFLSYLFFGDT